jgi:hypothetical protein
VLDFSATTHNQKEIFMRRKLAIIFMLMLLLNRCSDSSTNPSASDEFFEAKVNGVQWIGDMTLQVSPPGRPPLSAATKIYNGSSLMLGMPRRVELFTFPDFLNLRAFRQENGEMVLASASLSIPMQFPNPPMPIIITSIRSFELMPDSQNVIRITRLDTTQRIIEGEFRFRARETITRLDSLDQFGLPITVLGDSVITVTDGRFRIKYETEPRYFLP